MQSPHILFAGGGSVGHLAPSMAVAEALVRMVPDARATFVCAPREEEELMLMEAKLPYARLIAPKFPRGWTLAYVHFPLAAGFSLVQAARLVRSYQPDLVFSKGGFTSVPVCLAAWLRRIPIVLHESDTMSGLSNRLIGLIARGVCVGFPPHDSEGNQSHVSYTGNPIRPFIRSGSRDAGMRITGFSGRRPVIMVIGGSQGSQAINEAVEKQLSGLLDLGDLVHLTGFGKEVRAKHARYWSRSYVTDDLPHLYALADIVISRAGAGVLSELAVLYKPVIAIPLKGVAQNHQWKNAKRLQQAGAVKILDQECLSELTATVRSLLHNEMERERLGRNLSEFFPADAAERVAKVLTEVMGQ